MGFLKTIAVDWIRNSSPDVMLKAWCYLKRRSLAGRSWGHRQCALQGGHCRLISASLLNHEVIDSVPPHPLL